MIRSLFLDFSLFSPFNCTHCHDANVSKDEENITWGYFTGLDPHMKCEECKIACLDPKWKDKCESVECYDNKNRFSGLKSCLWRNKRPSECVSDDKGYFTCLKGNSKDLFRMTGLAKCY